MNPWKTDTWFSFFLLFRVYKTQDAFFENVQNTRNKKEKK